jgi:hypothetical protein
VHGGVSEKLGGSGGLKVLRWQRRGSAREDPGEQRPSSSAWRARWCSPGGCQQEGECRPDLGLLGLDLGLLGPDLGPMGWSLQRVEDAQSGCRPLRPGVVEGDWWLLPWPVCRRKMGCVPPPCAGVGVLRLCDYFGEMLR